MISQHYRKQQASPPLLFLSEWWSPASDCDVKCDDSTTCEIDDFTQTIKKALFLIKP